jgi:CHAD domain-containing protein
MPSVGTLVRQRLAEQRDALRAADAAVRAGEATGVHDLRVAMRRLRSLLATYRPIFDGSVTEPVRDELKDASGRLGTARDAEVAADCTDRLLREAGLDGAEEEAVAGLRARLRLDAAAGADAVDETLGSTRYAALLILLDDLVAHPPLTEDAQQEAGPAARRRVRKEAGRFTKHAVAARNGRGEAEGEEDRRDRDDRGGERGGEHGGGRRGEPAVDLHEVRKAAKRLRYAAETAAPVSGKKVWRIGRRAKRVQSALGDHHDAVMTRATLRHLALDEAVGEAAAFLLGHLDADEQRAMTRLEEQSWQAIGDLEDTIAAAR